MLKMLLLHWQMFAFNLPSGGNKMASTDRAESPTPTTDPDDARSTQATSSRPQRRMPTHGKVGKMRKVQTSSSYASQRNNSSAATKTRKWCHFQCVCEERLKDENIKPRVDSLLTPPPQQKISQFLAVIEAPVFQDFHSLFFRYDFFLIEK